MPWLACYLHGAYLPVGPVRVAQENRIRPRAADANVGGSQRFRKPAQAEIAKLYRRPPFKYGGVFADYHRRRRARLRGLRF